MSPKGTFRAASARAVLDTGLRAKIKHAVTQFRRNREAVYAELDDVAAYRARAGQARMDSLSRLPELLETLEARMTEAGGVVHWAEDAAHAREIIGSLARERGVRTVVKGKSMITEEIVLNPHLESLGMEVWESDLGEFIVQLAGEPPSHIITPALHKSREDVTALFAERLGRTDEAVEGLTAIARQVLREKFLAADLCITGANMAIAETGTVVTVENEGNIRMGTTCAPLHIAVMSIEKVLAGLEEFSAVIEMLPRSATGQRISTYVSLFTGPRRAGEADGAHEFHLVLLDNGRSRIMADPDLRQVLACIRCGSCLNACPIYQSVGGYAYGAVYSGPIGSLLTPLLGSQEGSGGQGGDLPWVCTGCQACVEVCPVGIDHPRLMLTLRERQAPGSLPLALHAALAARPGLYNAATGLMRGLNPGLGLAKLSPAIRRFARKRSLPRLKRPFTGRNTGGERD